MAKDPAALIYIDKWIAATNGTKAEFRAWYMDLLIYQYDKGSIPNDEDEIAGICRVRPSEYNLFQQMLQQVLKQKFKQEEDGTWINPIASDIISKRKNFKEKRAKSGTIGYIIKKAKSISGFKKPQLDQLKSILYEKNIDELEDFKNEQVLKQMLEQKGKLYVNVDEDVDEDININNKGGVGEFSQPLRNPMELPLEDLISQMQNEATWKETVCKNVREADRSFNMDSLEDYLEQFFKTIETDGEEYKTVKDTKKHFSRWLAIEIKNKNNGKGKSTHQNSSGPSDEYRRKTAERLGLKQS